MRKSASSTDEHAVQPDGTFTLTCGGLHQDEADRIDSKYNILASGYAKDD